MERERVFISYSKKHRDLTVELASYLNSCGLTVWWDQDLVARGRSRMISGKFGQVCEQAGRTIGRISGVSMFQIERIGLSPELPKLVATGALNATDFDLVGVALGEPPIRACKTGLVAARQANAVERVVTHWNGKESEDTASPGDFVVTSLARDGSILRDAHGQANIYVIRAARMLELYAPVAVIKLMASDAGQAYRPIGTVDALFFAGGFDIIAPWGERQLGAAGYLVRNGGDVYGNHKDTFEATYVRI